MASFDELLQNLHGDGKSISTIDDAGQVITITSKRTFEVPKDYNLVLAYAGDVNSQIVTFALPLTHEGHELSACTNKKVKWKNLASGSEGVSTLVKKEELENTWSAEWEVPPEIMTQAGKIEMAISLYDIKDNKIAFSWNTPPFNGFSIGESFVEVGTYWEENGFQPPKNEILTINVDTKTIVMPRGYNTIVANYGDIGTSNVYFEVPRYIGGLDVSDNSVRIRTVVAFSNKEVAAEFNILTSNRKPMFGNGEKYLLCWQMPPEITCNAEYYTGVFSLSLKIEKIAEDNETIEQRWITSTFNKLSIGPSLVQQDVTEFASREENVVIQIIDEYFDNREFVVDGDE